MRKTENEDRDQSDQSDQGDQGDQGDRDDRNDQSDRDDRNDRSDRNDQSDHLDYLDQRDQLDQLDQLEQLDRRAPLLTDDDITERVARLIGRARRQQLWLLFLDDSSVMLPTLMPSDELPSPIDDDIAAALAAMLRQAIAGTPIESVIVVWERPGGPIARVSDRRSAAALAWACADAGVPVRAQLISHDHGVRSFAAEEFTPLPEAALVEPFL